MISLCFRLLIHQCHFLESSMGSPGIDELRWFAPVRPGDTLHSEVEVIAFTPSRSKPDRGIARLQYKAVNQRGEVFSSYFVNHVLKGRGG